jgi:hypothetical protein
VAQHEGLVVAESDGHAFAGSLSFGFAVCALESRYLLSQTDGSIVVETFT